MCAHASASGLSCRDAGGLTCRRVCRQMGSWACGRVKLCLRVRVCACRVCACVDLCMCMFMCKCALMRSCTHAFVPGLMCWCA